MYPRSAAHGGYRDPGSILLHTAFKPFLKRFNESKAKTAGLMHS